MLLNKKVWPTSGVCRGAKRRRPSTTKAAYNTVVPNESLHIRFMLAARQLTDVLRVALQQRIEVEERSWDS